jgi:hypothetical protein
MTITHAVGERLSFLMQRLSIKEHELVQLLRVLDNALATR